MTSNWYYEVHGKAEGPISTSELIKKIQAGELSLLGLVFREGDAHWMPAESFPELKELIHDSSTGFKLDADWIVLRRFEVDGKMQQEQIGPFSSEQILQLLDRGKIRFTDYVWRTGYEAWAPLGRVDEFEAPLKSSVAVDKTLYDKPRREPTELKPVKAFKPTLQKNDEERPHDAKGEDLAQPVWEKLKPLKSQERQIEVRKETVAKENQEGEERRAKDRRTKERREKLKETEDTKPLETSEEITRSVPADETTATRTVQRRWLNVANLLLIFTTLAGLGLFAIYGPGAYRQWKSTTSHPTIVFEKKQEPVIVAPPPRPTEVTKVVPPPPVVSAPIEKTPSLEEKKPVAEKTIAYDGETTPLEKMNEKQASYFKSKERLFLFYQAQKGLRLVNEAEKELQKKAKKKGVAPKVSLKSWLQQVKSYRAQIEKEAPAERFYPELNKKLLKVTQMLWERGKDIDAQLAQSRVLSKASVFKDIEADYKSLVQTAKNLE